MKKLLAMLVAFTLLLVLAACGETQSAPAPETAVKTEAPADQEPPGEAEAPAVGEAPEEELPEAPLEEELPGEDLEDLSRTEEALLGVWYCQIEGVDLSLELKADGAYSMTLLAAPEESVSGVWRLDNGFVWLDDSEEPFSVMGDSLYWHAIGAFATREEPAPIYSPALPVEGVPLGTMDGYWVATFLEVDGQVFSTEMLGENMDLYVEGQRAALGGLFGDQIVDLEDNDGVLRFAGEGFCADMALQADGFMRLTLSGDFEGELHYYLLPVTLNNAEEAED